MREPKHKHYGLVIGVAIATIVGFSRGAAQSVSTRTDYIALVIAFLIILGIFAFAGWIVDHTMHVMQKKKYHAKTSQNEFDYDDLQQKASK